MFFPLLSVISCEEGKALADSWNAAFMESSAKENQVMMMMMMTPATPRLIYSLANSVLTSSIAVGAILAQNVPRQLQSSLNTYSKSNVKGETFGADMEDGLPKCNTYSFVHHSQLIKLSFISSLW